MAIQLGPLAYKVVKEVGKKVIKKKKPETIGDLIRKKKKQKTVEKGAQAAKAPAVMATAATGKSAQNPKKNTRAYQDAARRRRNARRRK